MRVRVHARMCVNTRMCVCMHVLVCTTILVYQHVVYVRECKCMIGTTCTMHRVERTGAAGHACGPAYGDVYDKNALFCKEYFYVSPCCFKGQICRFWEFGKLLTQNRMRVYPHPLADRPTKM